MGDRRGLFDFDADLPSDPIPSDHIDPRIAVRREEVARVARRRLRRRSFAAVVATVIVVGSAVGARSAMFHVDQVEVAGAARTGEGVVRERAGIEPGTPMLAIDEHQVDRAVSSLPWIESVEVRRRWPSTVEIQVRERAVAAAVPAGTDRWQLVGADGVVVAEVDEPPTDLVLVLGVPAVGVLGDRIEVGDGRLSVATAIPPRLRDRVSAVAEVGGELQLHMDPSGMVRLGDLSRLDQKLLAVETLFTRVDGRCIDVVDVRAPQAPTVRRDEACAGPPPTTTTTPTEGSSATTAPPAATIATTTPLATATTAPAGVLEVPTVVPDGAVSDPAGGSPSAVAEDVVPFAPTTTGILP
jgi:cell division protein FtsQ